MKWNELLLHTNHTDSEGKNYYYFLFLLGEKALYRDSAISVQVFVLSFSTFQLLILQKHFDIKTNGPHSNQNK